DLNPDRLIYSVFEGNSEVAADDEARELWKKIAGVGDSQILGFGMKDNFWAMGDTGPCGPCSEIHYEMDRSLPCSNETAGKSCEGPNCDCDRWVEIWNLVFMQYERSSDGVMTPLPKPSIDTGMGFERVSAVIQGKTSNYEIDLFRDLIQDTSNLFPNREYGKDTDTDISLRVIADHIRASGFLIADGVYPSNEGRGYVLRRIMRRMIRHARVLGADSPLVHKLIPTLVRLMGDSHPVIREKEKIVMDAVSREEETFLATLDRGMALLDSEIAKLSGDTLPGATAFRLYDTYGFPPDLTEIITQSRAISLDHDGFDEEMKKQQERSRGASDFSADEVVKIDVTTSTEFVGYKELSCNARVLDQGSFGEGDNTQQFIVLDRSPFYAESGGQVGDRGSISNGDSLFDVSNTKKNAAGVYIHLGSIRQGSISDFSPESEVTAQANRSERLATERNHTATHLLHGALFEVLGDHVQQAGSYVGPDRLRFDFNHTKAVSRDEIERIEEIANSSVIENLAVATNTLPIEDAKKLGAKAFFGDKYSDMVRVVSIQGARAYNLQEGDAVSLEFCGGTHVRNTGEIGLTKITSESAIASGVRRLEAVTGMAALKNAAGMNAHLSDACQTLSTSPESFNERLGKFIQEKKKTDKELSKVKTQAALSNADSLIEKASEVKGIKVISEFIADLDQATLRSMTDSLSQKLGEGIVVLGSTPESSKGQKSAALCVRVSKNLTDRIKAGDIVGQMAQICGGGGGGKPEIAQAGGKKPENVPDAINQSSNIIEELLHS
ncbi:MAG: alanine--tRNA ligase, partial [Candidatus Lindowbacteria bacterium]|nr:alanine--tRNA ligase [Candidatus Lindowbacteria bacterium]